MTASRITVALALDAVREVVAAYHRSRDTTLEFSHAHLATVSALSSADEQVEFLMQIADAHRRGDIPRAAYQKLLVTVGRMLQGSAAFSVELKRLARTEGGG